jgi:signal transduction histidine kinase
MRRRDPISQAIGTFPGKGLAAAFSHVSTRLGIRQRLFMAFGLVAAIAATLAIFSLAIFHHLASSMTELAFGTMPELIAMQRTADDASELLSPIQSLALARTDMERKYWYGAIEERLAALPRARGQAVDADAGIAPLEAYLHKQDLIESVHRLDDAVGLRFETSLARVGAARRSADEYIAFTDAIKAVERRIRTVAILTLSLKLPEAPDQDALRVGINGFIEREMSWLATVQEVRSVGNDLVAIVSAAANEDDREALPVLRRRAEAILPRLGLVKRLPESPELTVLGDAAARLASVVLPKERDIFSYRQSELDSGLAVGAALADAQSVVQRVHAEALRMLSRANRAVDDTVKATRSSIDWAEALVGGFAIVSGLGVFVMLRRYVTRNLLLRLHALKSCLLAGAAAARREAAPPVLAELQSIAKMQRDEISEMAASVQDFVGAIAERELALQEAKLQAEAANRTKSQFLANMSHELRTPLNAILGFSELIKDEFMGPVPARYQGYARDIHSSGAHLLRIINDVLDLSKIEADRLELNDQEVVLAEIAETCNRLVADLAQEKTIAVQLQVAADLRVRGDELRLKQVLLNLLSNAVKFTPDGGRIVVAAHRKATGETVLAVDDTGVGMTREEIAIAVQPFRQVDATFARRAEGTGLGLALAKRLVELHGGRLDLTSEPGRGTTAEVVFPAARAVPPDAESCR